MRQAKIKLTAAIFVAMGVAAGWACLGQSGKVFPGFPVHSRAQVESYARAATEMALSATPELASSRVEAVAAMANSARRADFQAALARSGNAEASRLAGAPILAAVGAAHVRGSSADAQGRVWTVRMPATVSMRSPSMALIQNEDVQMDVREGLDGQLSVERLLAVPANPPA